MCSKGDIPVSVSQIDAVAETWRDSAETATSKEQLASQRRVSAPTANAGSRRNSGARHTGEEAKADWKNGDW